MKSLNMWPDLSQVGKQLEIEVLVYLDAKPNVS